MAMERTPARGAGKASASRTAVLQVLRQFGDAMTVQEIADRLKLHKSSVRFHLDRLIRAGLVREEQSSPTGPGRPRLVYTARDPQDPNPPTGHQILAEALSEYLVHSLPGVDALAVQAGEEQGRRMTSAHSDESATEEDGKEAVTALMQDSGFDPQWDADGERLWLRTCPFRPVSDQQPAVACSVHLGMMRGTLEALHAPLEVVSLDAADAPHPCLAVFKAAQPPRKAPEPRDGTVDR